MMEEQLWRQKIFAPPIVTNADAPAVGRIATHLGCQKNELGKDPTPKEEKKSFASIVTNVLQLITNVAPQICS